MIDMGRTKVEKSDHFHEIVDMKEEGFSCQKISDHLLYEYGEVIGHTAICNYFSSLKKKTAEK